MSVYGIRNRRSLMDVSRCTEMKMFISLLSRARALPSNDGGLRQCFCAFVAIFFRLLPLVFMT